LDIKSKKYELFLFIMPEILDDTIGKGKEFKIQLNSGKDFGIYSLGNDQRE
jgi:hypothetical protein